MTLHETYMHRCLELARMGAGHVAPNPMVGAVLVHDGKIIGEGWHRKWGEAHAEVNAISEVKDKSLLKESTLYVNLEPCSHTGKTPPCSLAIIQAGIPHVVFACSDPNPKVNGKGAGMLRDAGIKVESGILEKEASELNKRFITFQTQNRPYVILKWAQTRNGFIAPDASKMSKEQFEEERHITGLVVQRLVHKWRTMEDAVMVATHTALTDNPALNARAWSGRNPIRVVLDQNLRLPHDLKMFNNEQPTIVVNGSKEEVHENTHWMKVDFRGDWYKEMLHRFVDVPIQSLVIEGGAKLLNHVIGAGLWDEAIVFYSPSNITSGVAAPLIGGKIILQDQIGDIQMTQYLNT